jgi:hypothetical protein
MIYYSQYAFTSDSTRVVAIVMIFWLGVIDKCFVTYARNKHKVSTAPETVFKSCINACVTETMNPECERVRVSKFPECPNSPHLLYFTRAVDQGVAIAVSISTDQLPNLIP